MRIIRTIPTKEAMQMSCDSRDDHLTTEFLEKWPTLPFAYQMQGAYHVSTGCRKCWSAINAARLSQPLGHSDPFLRALARVRLLPKVDLSLSSQAIRSLVWEPFRPDDFPTLLLQESIGLGLESEGPNRVANYLGLPSSLAELLKESPATETTGTDLRINVDCAAVEFYLLAGDTGEAEKHLESAKEHLGDLGDRCDVFTQVNVMLAEFILAASRDRTEAARCSIRLTDDGFPLLVHDPVRRFELSCEVNRCFQQIGESDKAKTAMWPLSELELGQFGHVIHRLNGLFYKARYVVAFEPQLPSLPRAVVSELESAYETIKENGDLYSLGHYHQLRGELGRDEAAFDGALEIFLVPGLERPFFEAWLKLDRLMVETESPRLSERRHQIASQAAAIFGKDVAQSMVRATPWYREAVPELGGVAS
jgi:hypothetical protein